MKSSSLWSVGKWETVSTHPLVLMNNFNVLLTASHNYEILRRFEFNEPVFMFLCFFGGFISAELSRNKFHCFWPTKTKHETLLERKRSIGNLGQNWCVFYRFFVFKHAQFQKKLIWRWSLSRDINSEKVFLKQVRWGEDNRNSLIKTRNPRD